MSKDQKSIGSINVEIVEKWIENINHLLSMLDVLRKELLTIKK